MNSLFHFLKLSELAYRAEQEVGFHVCYIILWCGHWCLVPKTASTLQHAITLIAKHSFCLGKIFLPCDGSDSLPANRHFCEMVVQLLFSFKGRKFKTLIFGFCILYYSLPSWDRKRILVLQNCFLISSIYLYTYLLEGN